VSRVFGVREPTGADAVSVLDVAVRSDDRETTGVRGRNFGTNRLLMIIPRLWFWRAGLDEGCKKFIHGLGNGFSFAFRLVL